MVVMDGGALAKITKQSPYGSSQTSLHNQLIHQSGPKVPYKALKICSSRLAQAKI
jgi:hypothetical protein